MKEFTLYLKSHCESPDLEATVEAKDWWEALHKFESMYDIDGKTIFDNMSCDGIVGDNGKQERGKRIHETIKKLEREWA
jgi:hypothetical protein